MIYYAECCETKKIYNDITGSKLLLDEDLDFILMQCSSEKKNKFFKGVVVAGLALTTTLFFVSKGRTELGIIAYPVISTLTYTLYKKVQYFILRKQIQKLIEAFKNLVLLHKETTDFVKSFQDQVREPFFKIAKLEVADLIQSLILLEQSVVISMKEVICELHVEFKFNNLDLDIADLEQLTIFSDKTETIKESLDYIHMQSTEDFRALEPVVESVAQELYQCYCSTGDLKKLLEVINRNRRRAIESDLSEDQSEEEVTENLLVENLTMPSEDTSSQDLVYQQFQSGYEGDENEEELEQSHEQSELLLELRQSDEFKKRERSFNTVKSSKSKSSEDSSTQTPSALTRCIVSPISSTSSTPYPEIPLPPPPPPALENEGSLYFSAQTEEPEEEDDEPISNLQISLQSVLQKMQISPNNEEQFE
ncbi:hypothetical protein HHI36_023331 [Cryptolaemus montrouzieri]|uniref:Uncharacterized protein n=1 Tax=Cryptolaemus montrouzieri TaxID=559131 RepID=A0ABD2PG27_9CUCU